TDLTLTGVANEIKQSVATPPDPTDKIAIAIFNSFLQVFGIIGNLAVPGSNIGAATGLMGAFFGTVNALLVNGNGDPITEIDGTLGEIADQLSNDWPLIISGTNQMFKNILS